MWSLLVVSGDTLIYSKLLRKVKVLSVTTHRPPLLFPSRVVNRFIKGCPQGPVSVCEKSTVTNNLLLNNNLLLFSQWCGPPLLTDRRNEPQHHLIWSFVRKTSNCHPLERSTPQQFSSLIEKAPKYIEYFFYRVGLRNEISFLH